MAGLNNNFPYGNLNSGAATYPQYSLPAIQPGYSPSVSTAPVHQSNYESTTGYEAVSNLKTAPNSQVVLFHESSPIFFSKVTDQSGNTDIRAYQYTEIDISKVKPKTNDDLFSMMQELTDRISRLESEKNNESVNAAKKQSYQQSTNKQHSNK